VIHQDATLYVSELDRGRSVTHALAPGRRAYVFVTAGEMFVNGERLGPSDAAAVEAETRLEFKATAPSAFVLWDLP
jgi:redox-sensitive bicupin YhaK (pirin superfamily)